LGFAKKALTRSVQVFRSGKFHITSRSSTSRYAPWTVFKSRFCGFAAQKYSTKPQLKNCRLARRYRRQEIKSYSFGNIAKGKAVCFEECMFLVLRFGEFGFLSKLKKECFLFYASESTSFVVIERT
jgi:hypothetical protein